MQRQLRVLGFSPRSIARSPCVCLHRRPFPQDKAGLDGVTPYATSGRDQHQLLFCLRRWSYVRLGLGAEAPSPTKRRANISRKLVLRKLKRQLKKSARSVESDIAYTGWLASSSPSMFAEEVSNGLWYLRVELIKDVATRPTLAGPIIFYHCIYILDHVRRDFLYWLSCKCEFKIIIVLLG